MYRKSYILSGKLTDLGTSNTVILNVIKASQANRLNENSENGNILSIGHRQDPDAFLTASKKLGGKRLNLCFSGFAYHPDG